MTEGKQRGFLNQYDPHRFKQVECLVAAEDCPLEVVGAQIDHRIGRVGKVRFFEVGVAEQRPFEIAQRKIGFWKRPIAKIDLFGSAFAHHQPFQIQTEKIAVIEDALAKADRNSMHHSPPNHK